MEERKLHISAGRGPAECTWVVARVLNELLTEASKEGLQSHMVQRSEGELPHTLVSATVLVRGNKAGTFAQSWIGSVQWIGKSPYRKFHKRKNWFVEVHERGIVTGQQLDPSDIRIQVMRASGPGGQHVNKTSSAVRMVHEPTGLTVTIQESRSQLQNRKIAMQRLQELYEEQRLNALEDDQKD